jgi:hypothetical protein
MDATPLALFSLGALHGINPGMGWLFAVALGLQEGSRRAVWRALVPLAVGHAAAVAVAVAIAAALGAVLPAGSVRMLVALVLLAMAFRLFMKAKHRSAGGMRVNRREIALWSFLMSSAHGAGVMVLPLLLPAGASGGAGAHAHHAGMQSAGSATPAITAIAATVLHTAGYLGVAALVAIVVYERLGLRMLRKLWVNVDAIWGGALVVTATFVMLQ